MRIGPIEIFYRPLTLLDEVKAQRKILDPIVKDMEKEFYMDRARIKAGREPKYTMQERDDFLNVAFLMEGSQYDLEGKI